MFAQTKEDRRAQFCITRFFSRNGVKLPAGGAARGKQRRER
jgi:hypothetical protein